MTQRGVCYEINKRDLDSRNETCNKTLANKNRLQKTDICLISGQLRSSRAKEHEEKGKSGENSGPLKVQHYIRLKLYNSLHTYIYCIFPNSQENCFSSLESPRVQKLRKRPEYNHMHSLQNECKTNSVKKGNNNYLSHYW